MLIGYDGTYRELKPFARTARATVELDAFAHEPNRIQFDLAERFAAFALYCSPDCVLEFGPRTSPWSFEGMNRLFGSDWATHDGQQLPWGRKNSYSGTLRYRRKPKYELLEASDGARGAPKKK